MEIKILKTVEHEDLERYYSLYRIDGKTIRIRGVCGWYLIAEIFSSVLLSI